MSAFKTGPDYIDPCYLRAAGKCEAYNLDTWLMSRERVSELFMRGARGSDVAVIEGAMGLYDGGECSTSEIAKLLGAPVVLVMDVKSLGESAAAMAVGFREYDPDVDLAGVILNNAGSEYHVNLIAEALEERGIKCLGAIRREDGLRVSERHLGLALEERGKRTERLRYAVESGIDVAGVMRIAECGPELRSDSQVLVPSVSGVRVGVARDEAFMFYYPESLEILEELGAEIVEFSPLRDEELPEAEGYIFGGGYPELYAEELSVNGTMLASVRSNVRPVLAECGGMMYLCRSLRDLAGVEHEMSGVIPFEAEMSGHAMMGYMEARALRRNILCEEGERVRGHEFHYSRVRPEYEEGSCAYEFRRRKTGALRLGGYAAGNVLGSYLHVNFWGNEVLAENFVRALTSSKV